MANFRGIFASSLIAISFISTSCFAAGGDREHERDAPWHDGHGGGHGNPGSNPGGSPINNTNNNIVNPYQNTEVKSSNDNSLDSGDDSYKTEAFLFSYTEAQPQIPQAVVNGCVTVLSHNYKILGPIFGGAWQDTEVNPECIGTIHKEVIRATTNDGTYEDQQKQAAMIAVLCNLNGGAYKGMVTEFEGSKMMSNAGISCK